MSKRLYFKLKYTIYAKKFNLYLLFHKSVSVAVNVNISSASQLNMCFRIAFGIKSDKLHTEDLKKSKDAAEATSQKSSYAVLL